MDKRLIPVLLLSFVNIIGFVILIPVLPFLVEENGAGAMTYGALLAAYPLFQFLVAPLLGSLSDRYGRRPILLISQAGTLLSWLVFAGAYFVPNVRVLTLSLPLLIVGLARVTDGITGGNVSVANAYIADITKPAQRTKVYGLMGAAMGIGLMLGPAIGGVTSSLGVGFLGTALTAAAISLVTLVWMFLSLPETLNDEHRTKEVKINLKKELNILSKVAKYKDNKLVSRLLFIRMFFAFGFQSFTSIIVLFMIDAYDLNANQVGILFLVFGVYLIINQGFVAQLIAKRLGDLKAFYLSQVFMAVGFLLSPFAPTAFWFVVVNYLANLGFSVSFPTFKALLTSGVDKSRQGEISGVDESIMALSGAFAPLVAGGLYQLIDKQVFGILAVIIALPHLINVVSLRKVNINA